MSVFFSRTAANTLYLGFVHVYFVVAILGLLEQLFFSLELMPIITLSSTLVSLGLGGILLLLQPVNFPTKVKPLGYLLIVLGFVLLAHFQINIWGQPNTAWLWVNANGFITSLNALLVLSFMCALTIKVFNTEKSGHAGKVTQRIIFAMILIGFGLWHLSGINTVERETNNAKSKVHLLETMLNRNVTEYVSSFGRIKSRLESVSEEDFHRLVGIDFTNYTADHVAIEGFVLLNTDLQPVITTAFAERFNQRGVLDDPSVQAWLRRPSETIRYGITAATLNADVPIVMFAFYVEKNKEEKYQVLALLNVDRLIEHDYLDYLSSYAAYVELNNDMYFSLNASNKFYPNLQALMAEYEHFIIEPIQFMNRMDFEVYTYIEDYSALNNAAKTEQGIIWFTLIFVLIYTFASDSVYLLRKQSNTLYNMAHFDELTGLMRRDALTASIKTFQQQYPNKNTAIVFLNLDGFSAVNNSVGHTLGDQVLVMVARRLETHASQAEAISRFGNDEFLLFYCDISEEDLIVEVTQVMQTLAGIYSLGEVDVHLTASAGIAVSINSETNDKLILQQADIAMDYAKQQGGNQLSFYRSVMDERHQRMVEIRGQLQKAINQGDIEVFYQPIHQLSDGHIASVEALARWKNGDTYISPAVFIPVAEKTGQIHQVGELVLEQALNDMRDTPEFAELGVSINFSPQQLQQTSFVRKLLLKVRNKGLVPERITVEITETVMSEKGVIEGILKALIAEGFNVAIDDFGTGFSSLSYLSRQPANIIKIDREFTFDTEEPGQKRSLLEAVIKVCLELNKKVVVEGVEQQALIDYLQGIDKVLVQGFYFSKPLPLAELQAYVNAHQVT